jgi:hypothetical protein
MFANIPGWLGQEQFPPQSIPARPRQALQRHAGASKKMLIFDGTNSTNPLESTKVPKKQTQMRPKQTGKTC